MSKVVSFFSNPKRSLQLPAQSAKGKSLLKLLPRQEKVRSLAIFTCLILFTLSVTYLTPYVKTESSSPMPLLRLHVVANSDEFNDQELKLLVRDDILAFLNPRLESCTTLEESREIVQHLLTDIENVALQRVENAGHNYLAKAEVGRFWFPVRQYQDFTAPAGEYEALRITLGTGYGANWWCVLYPPLCLEDVSMRTDLVTDPEIVNVNKPEIEIRSKLFDWLTEEAF